jgi:hypothetical protein
MSGALLLLLLLLDAWVPALALVLATRDCTGGYPGEWWLEVEGGLGFGCGKRRASASVERE